MNDTNKLHTIVATISVVLFIAFILTISKLAENNELQGGDIQHAIETNQYQ
jgi:hypothetical protein